MIIVNTMYGKTAFNSVKEMWNAVAEMQAQAWKELDIMHVSRNSPTRYETLESLEAWRYARQIADAAAKQ